MMTMEELAKRCEAATGPDRELDIAMLPLVGLRFKDEGHPFGRVCYDVNNHGVPMPHFTASIDAAMSLVPEGWRIGQLEENWRSGRWHSCVTERPTPALIEAFVAGKTIGYKSQEGEAATPALALCAAALRARAQGPSQ